MKIKITVDSTSDFSPELIKKYDIGVISLKVHLGEDERQDGVDINNYQIFEYVTKTGQLPKTGANSPEEYKDFFKQYIDEGYKVIHFSLSDELSSSFNNAQKAAEEFSNIKVINSKSLSTGIALLALHACTLAQQDIGWEEIYEKCCERVPYVQASFIVDNLQYLYKGGRCSALSLLGANLLRLKPCIEVKNGKMGVEKKYRGNLSKCFELYVNDILEKYPHPDKTRVFITFTTFDQSNLEKMATYLKNYGFQEVLITSAGSTITSHCGKNTIGVLYINDAK